MNVAWEKFFSEEDNIHHLENSKSTWPFVTVKSIDHQLFDGPCFLTLPEPIQVFYMGFFLDDCVKHPKILKSFRHVSHAHAS